MFCRNCGNKLKDVGDFCTSCGARKNKEVVYNNFSNSSTTQALKNNSIKSTIDKIKSFVAKNNKPLLIGLSIIAVIIIGIILFINFYDFTKINWVEDFGDNNLEYVSPSTIRLKAEAYDKEDMEIFGITYSSKDGTIEIKDEIAYWTLPKDDGEYTIVATSPSGKKIEKNIKVINVDNETNGSNLGGLLPEVVDENTDSDGDTLTNKKEEELKTDPYSADTDSDGLIDTYEINESKTDPLKADSDGDGLKDGDELDLNLDPLKADSKDDGINDGDRELTYTLEDKNNEISLEINGKGNIASATIDILENTTLANIDGLLDKVYNFYTDGTITSAVVKIKYNLEELTAQGLNEDNLTFYYFNEETKELEEIKTIVDKENKQIIVTLKHFSKYVIGDKNIVLTNAETDIMFVIDNSVSMYTYNQLSEAGYYDITGADGNDSDFKRLSLTNKMIDMFTGNYKFGVSEFAGSYKNLEDFSSNKESVKSAVNSMNTDFHVSTTGTNIITALESGIDEFTADDNNHYLILLTDGKNTSGSLILSKTTIINNAKEKNVRICVIGLGNELDTDDLNEIAESTGCDYYSASNANALDEIYSIMGADINYNLVDTDGDGKTDGTIIADSGFITSRDGFSFENYVTVQSTGGNCYGMAAFAMLRYNGNLPLTMDAKHINKVYLSYLSKINMKSSGYDLTNTYFATNGNLYDYKIQDEAIKVRILYYLPEDIRNRVENGVFYVNDKYYDMLRNIGVSFEIKKYEGNVDGIEKFQAVGRLDVENEKFIQNANYEDVQMLKAIWRLYMMQPDSKKFSMVASPDKTFSKLVENLENGIPVILGIGGNHAVNAVRLIQNIDDANKFKLEIYDNNNPGEIKYIEITRTKQKKLQLDYTAWTNEYEYKFKYDAYNDENIDVDISEIVWE